MATGKQPRFKNAVVVLANYAQFDARQRVSNPYVASRMLLWSKAGAGQVTINKQRFTPQPGDYFFLPWHHNISYVPDPKDPFFLAGIHIIPDHGKSKTVVYEVAHTPTHRLAKTAWRKDLVIPELPGIVQGSFTQQPGLRHLAEYLVQVYQSHSFKEWQMRSLAACLLEELVRSVTTLGTISSAIPLELKRMLRFIEERSHTRISLKDLKVFSRVSGSTIGRMFISHLKLTPVEWIIKVKMDRARQLLATSRQNVNQVGQQVGYEDLYYFSKVFKKTVGMPPLQYRKRHYGI